MPEGLEERVARNTEAIADMKLCVQELADTMLGTPRSEFAGGGRKSDGLVHKVESIDERTKGIEDRLSNGGVRFTLPPAVWTFVGTVAAAMIGGIVTLLVKVL